MVLSKEVNTTANRSFATILAALKGMVDPSVVTGEQFVTVPVDVSILTNKVLVITFTHSSFY